MKLIASLATDPTSWCKKGTNLSYLPETGSLTVVLGNNTIDNNALLHGGFQKCIQLLPELIDMFYISLWRFHCGLYSYPLAKWVFSLRVGPLLVVLHAYNIKNFFSTCSACSEVVFEFEWRATCFGSLMAKLISAPLGMPKWVWPSMNFLDLFLLKPPHYLKDCTEIKQTGKVLYAKEPKGMLSWRITLVSKKWQLRTRCKHGYPFSAYLSWDWLLPVVSTRR